MFTETHGARKGCSRLNRDRLFKGLWVELAVSSPGSEKTIWNVVTEKMVLPRLVCGLVSLSLMEETREVLSSC